MKKILKKLINIVGIIINWTIYYISLMFPRNNKIWVFVGWRKSKEREIFAENPKYVFLYTAQNKKEIRPIWIGKDNFICKILKSRGYEAYSMYSLKGIYFSLRAGYTFLGGLMQPYNWRLSSGSKIIQLWHGKSLKKTGYNSPYGLTRYNRFLNPGLFVTYHKFIAISKYLAEFAIQDFNLKNNQLLISGTPKYDPLISNVKDADIDCDNSLLETIKTVKAKHPTKLIMFGPTFRPDGSNPLLNIDLQKMDNFLKINNYILLIALHPKFSVKDWIPDVKLNNITFSQNDYDTYPVLSNFDALITDYSSLCMDFLFMDRPVVLYAPDIDTFKEGMGIYDELWSLMPGPKAFTFDELLNILADAVNQPSEVRKKARETLFSFHDSSASKRIVETLLSETGIK